MADAINITPPPAQVQTVSAGGQQTQSATEAGAPQPNLPPGTLVSGTIAGKDANGNYLLKTAQGTFSLQSKVPLTYNSDVVIRIGATTAGNTTTRIVSVNGEPFADFATPEPNTTDSISPALLVQTPATSTTDTPTALPGVIVSAPPAAQQPPGTPAFTEGSNVIVRLSQAAAEQLSNNPQETAATSQPAATAPVAVSATVATQPQQIAQSSQPVAVQPQPSNAPAAPTTIPAAATISAAVETDLAPQETVAPATQSGASQNQTPQTQTPQTPASQTAQQIPATPASALYSAYTKQSATASSPAFAAPVSGAPAAPATAAPSLTQTATLSAQIISADENGTLNLQTALGNVAVKAASLPALSSLAPGTAVTLELLAAEVTQAVSSEPAPLNELASSWQSLKDIMTLTNTANPPAANALLARLPQLGPGFLSNSTSFFTILLQGDARKLLGDDTVDTLRQNGRQDLLEKFSGELANLGASFAAPAERQIAGWQTLFLPFVYQEALQQARVFVKRDSPKKERSSKSTDDTRFVVEVDLSELGALQMDGLVRKKEQATAFDLVIRSHRAFSPADQAEILAIYTSAAELTGFKGSLAFQVTRDFPVKPLEEAAGNAPHIITA